MKVDYFEFSTFIMSYYNIARKNCKQKKYKILRNIRLLNTIFNNFEYIKNETTRRFKCPKIHLRKLCNGLLDFCPWKNFAVNTVESLFWQFQSRTQKNVSTLPTIATISLQCIGKHCLKSKNAKKKPKLLQNHILTALSTLYIIYTENRYRGHID